MRSRSWAVKVSWVMAVSVGLAFATAGADAGPSTKSVPASGVYAWGRGAEGQLGNGSFVSSSVPVRVNDFGSVRAVANSESTSYAVTRTGTVWSWGENVYGQLGNGTVIDPSSVPVRVSGLSDVTAVAGGSYNGYALRSDGRVWAWGDGAWGNLGTGVFLGTNGTTRYSSVPVRVKNLSGVVAISASEGTGYALRHDGTVWAWGLNNFGQLGNGSLENSALPVKVSALRGITAIASRGSAYARRSDGTVWAWGFGQFGELGNGTGDGQTLSFSRTPVRVRHLRNVTAIAAGGATGYALRADHTMWAWGDGWLGELGTGLNTLSNVPVRVPRLRHVSAIAAASQTVYAVTHHRTVWAWGYGIDGQLGNGQSPFASTVPVKVKVKTLPHVAAITAGTNTAYVRVR